LPGNILFSLHDFALNDFVCSFVRIRSPRITKEHLWADDYQRKIFVSENSRNLFNSRRNLSIVTASTTDKSVASVGLSL
jgi:hypothetical protein